MCFDLIHASKASLGCTCRPPAAITLETTVPGLQEQASSKRSAADNHACIACNGAAAPCAQQQQGLCR